MGSYTESSDYAKTSLLVLLFTEVIHIIAFGAPYWTTRPEGHAGLWEGCTGPTCYERYNIWVAGWIKASQTFMTIPVVALTGALLCTFLYIFHKHYDQDRRLILVSMVLTYISGISTALAVIIWGFSEHFGTGEILNWPFVLACASALCAFAAAFFLTKEMGAPLR